MSKNIFDIALDIFRNKGSFDENKGVSEHKRILKDEFKMFETALELGNLYKEAFDLVENRDEFYSAEPKYDVPWYRLKALKQQIKELENNEK